MKKLRFLFSSLLLSLMGATGAQAQWGTAPDPLTDITPGQDVALYSASGSLYLCGAGTSATVTDDAIYQFEEAGTFDGYTTYYLKQKSTGKYLKDEKLSGWLDTSDTGTWTGYTSDVAEAFTFTACYTGSTGDYRSAINEGLGFQGFILCSTYTYQDGEGATVPTYLGMYDDPFLSPWGDTNCWILREVTEMDGFDVLNGYLTELETAMENSNYVVGDDPGQVTAEALAALTSAKEEATRLLESGELTTEEATAEVNKLKELKAALDASRHPMTDGYYFISVKMTDPYYNRNSEATWVINDGVIGYPCWGEDVTLPTTPAEASGFSVYVWKVTKTGEDTYSLQNFSTGRYLGYETVANGNGVQVYQTVTTEESWTVKPQGEAYPGTFTIANMEKEIALNTANYANGGLCNWWSGITNDPRNSFYFTTVSQEILDYLSGTVVQERLNNSLQNIYDKALTAYSESRNFISSAPEAVTEESYTGNLGLIVDDSQLYANAPYTGGGADGAGTPALIDGDLSTYFHTDYNAETAPTDEDHYLVFDLGAPYSSFVIQYVARAAGYTGQATPSQVRFQSGSSMEGPWEDLTAADVTLPFQYACTWPGNEAATNGGAGVYAFDLLTPAQYFRMVVKGVASGSANHMKNGHYFWYLSEFHAYESEYDTNSPYESVSEAVRAELKDQLEEAFIQLQDGAATQATVDALQAAYDAFVAECPVPSVLAEAIAEARTWSENAEEGTLPGFYESGSLDAFNAVVAAAEAAAEGQLTVAVIDEHKSALEAATATLASHLILPQAGKTYVIKSLSESASSQALNSMVYAQSNALGAIKWGGYDYANSTQTAAPSEQLEYLWVLEGVQADGSCTLRNVGTGLYMGNQDKNNTAVNLSVEPCTINLRSARVPGGFNLGVSDGLFAKQGSTYNVVSWSSAQGSDNSAFSFVETAINEDGSTRRTVALGQAQVICLPYEVYAFFDKAEAYSVIGRNGDQLVLKRESSLLPAATPFIYIPADDKAEDTETFYVTGAADGPDGIAYVMEPTTVNGLVGTLTGATVGAGCGLFEASGITLSRGESASVGANSGWLNYLLPETTESGDLQLTLPGEITAISAIGIADNAPVDVYTLSGVRVRAGVNASVATQNLPAGVYVVGGKKVLVK